MLGWDGTKSRQSYGQGAAQKSLLTEALSVECGSSEHWTMVATVGIPGMLVYVAIIPTFISRVLIKQQHALTLYPSQENYQSKWTLRFGFMFAGYKEGYEWWESVVLLRKCLFVLLAIFLKQYGPAPQAVAASLILVVALSAEFQNEPYQDLEHDKIERIGIQACLLQLQVALLCNLIRDQPVGSAEELSSASDRASLGSTSTIILIIIMFGSTLYFFTVTIVTTIQSSQETLGIVGYLARRLSVIVPAKQSVVKNDDGKDPGGRRRSTIPRSVVVPAAAASHAHVYAALKMQSQLRLASSTMLKQPADAKQKSRGGARTRTRTLKRQDTTDVAKMIVKNASEHATAKKKQLEGMRRSSSSRLNNRLAKRKSRVKMTPIPLPVVMTNTPAEAPENTTASAEEGAGAGAEAVVSEKAAVAARLTARLVPEPSTAAKKEISTSNIDQKSNIEIIRMQLAKKLKNSNKLAEVILKLNKPEETLTLTKRKFLKLIYKLIEHIHPKIIPTKNLLNAIWNQARCNQSNNEKMNQNDDVIEKDRLDQWLFLRYENVHP